MPNIKGVLFDLGGVLVENPLYADLWKNKKGNKRLRTQFGMRQIGLQEYIRHGAKILGCSQKEFYRKTKKAYRHGKLIRPVFSIFKKIKISKYIFSNSNPIHLEYVKKNFSFVLALTKANFFTLRKERLVSFRKVIRLIGIKPTEVIFIDDKKEMIDRAKKIGMKAILYKNSIQLEKELRKFNVI